MTLIRIGLVGSVATGKSSVFQYLMKNTNGYDFVNEPLDTFNNFITVDNEHLKPLSMFYANNVESGFFQMYAVQCFEDIIQKTMSNDDSISHGNDYIVQVWDRLPHEVDIFSKSLHSMGLIPPFGYELCKKSLANMLQQTAFTIDGVYYVRSTPLECLTRVFQRQRSMETSYSNMLTHLTSLHCTYDSDLLSNRFTEKYNCSVCVSTFDDIESRGKECMKFIEDVVSCRREVDSWKEISGDPYE